MGDVQSYMHCFATFQTLITNCNIRNWTNIIIKHCIVKQKVQCFTCCFQMLHSYDRGLNMSILYTWKEYIGNQWIDGFSRRITEYKKNIILYQFIVKCRKATLRNKTDVFIYFRKNIGYMHPLLVVLVVQPITKKMHH